MRLSAVGRGGNVVLPANYIARDGSIQLGWASTVHVAQGRTADVGMTLIDDSTDLELLYVGATRGRYTNLIFGLGTEEEVLKAANAAARKVRAKLSATEFEEIVEQLAQTGHRREPGITRRHQQRPTRRPPAPTPSAPAPPRHIPAAEAPAATSVPAATQAAHTATGEVLLSKCPFLGV